MAPRPPLSRPTNAFHENELFRDFTDIVMERISRTMECEQRLVEQFVITCQKPVS